MGGAGLSLAELGRKERCPFDESEGLASGEDGAGETSAWF